MNNSPQKQAKMSGGQVMLVFIAGIASYLDAAILVSCGVALPLWTAHFDFSTWLSGAVNTALTFSVAIGATFGGAISDKFGRIVVFNIDILLVAIGTAMVAFTNNVTVLFVGLMLAGVASGADLPTSLAVISERMDKENYGKAISSTQLYWTVGIILSQFIGFLTSGLKDIQPVRYLFGFIAVAAFLNWLVRIGSKRFRNIESGLQEEVQTEEGTAEIAEEKPKLTALLSQKKVLIPLIMLTAYYVFWNLPANSFGMFLNYFLVTVDKQAAATATIVAMIGNILGFVANLIFMRTSDTKYRYHLVFGGLAMGLVAMFIAGLSAAYWFVFAVCYVVYMFGYIWIGEPIWKIWCQDFYQVNARASMTGLSLGITRFLTAVFALFTPTLMAISPALFLWILFGCVIVYGCIAIGIVRVIPRFGFHDEALEKLKAAKANK